MKKGACIYVISMLLTAGACGLHEDNLELPTGFKVEKAFAGEHGLLLVGNEARLGPDGNWDYTPFSDRTRIFHINPRVASWREIASHDRQSMDSAQLWNGQIAVLVGTQRPGEETLDQSLILVDVETGKMREAETHCTMACQLATGGEAVFVVCTDRVVRTNTQFDRWSTWEIEPNLRPTPKCAYSSASRSAGELWLTSARGLPEGGARLLRFVEGAATTVSEWEGSEENAVLALAGGGVVTLRGSETLGAVAYKPGGSGWEKVSLGNWEPAELYEGRIPRVGRVWAFEGYHVIELSAVGTLGWQTWLVRMDDDDLQARYHYVRSRRARWIALESEEFAWIGSSSDRLHSERLRRWPEG